MITDLLEEPIFCNFFSPQKFRQGQATGSIEPMRRMSLRESPDPFFDNPPYFSSGSPIKSSMGQLCIGNFGLATETMPLFAYKICAKPPNTRNFVSGLSKQARKPPHGEPMGEGYFFVLFIPSGRVIRKQGKTSGSILLFLKFFRPSPPQKRSSIF